MIVNRLRTEYLINPIGIDITKPRLMWNVAEGKRQSGFEIIANDDKGNELLNTGIIILILLPLFISLAIALWHIRPKMGRASNKGRPNHRSSNGIRHFSDKVAYSNHLRDITAEEICEDLSNQIYGMNYNIWVNQKSIKKAVLFDLISLAGFFAVIVYYGISKW